MKKTLKVLFTVICFAAIGFSYLRYTAKQEQLKKDSRIHDCELQSIHRAADQFEVLRYEIDADYVDQYAAAATFYWIRAEHQTRMQTCGDRQ